MCVNHSKKSDWKSLIGSGLLSIVMRAIRPRASEDPSEIQFDSRRG
jgi:hypothetical protein